MSNSAKCDQCGAAPGWRRDSAPGGFGIAEKTPRAESRCYQLIKQISLAAIAFLVFSGPVSAAPSSAFRAGDRWAVVGDSITQYGFYYAWIYLYHVTRFPDRPLEVLNCGVSGDSARGAVKRYEWDIKATHPTVATIMLGMNDVSRDLYADNSASPENLQQRQAALADYRENVDLLATQLQRDGVRVIFITPSPFDETVDVPFPRHTGVNGALAQCSVFMWQLAQAKDAAVVDLQGQMTALTARLQAKDPKFTLIGPDRVHPATAGHLVMAYFFLRAQGVPATVSEVAIDSTARAAKTDNARVEQVVVDHGTVSFTCLERALPYPVPDDARAALAWVPFQRELNQEALRVSGLKSGDYQLLIDNEPLATFSAEQLAAGVNLAEYATPQMRQARAVMSLVQEWQQTIANRLRIITEVEFWRLPEMARPITFEAAQPVLLAYLEGLKANPDEHADFNRSNVERYFAAKPEEAATRRQLAELETRIRAEAQPLAHRYVIAAVAAPASRR